MSSVQLYRYADSIKRDHSISAEVDGQPVALLSSEVEPFLTFGCNGPVRVVVNLPRTPESAVLSPKHLGLEVHSVGSKVEFTIPGPISVVLQIDGRAALYVFANPIETEAPSFDDPNVIVVKEGEVADPGETVLESGQSLYVQGGGVLRGRIRAYDAKSIQISGYGILDGSSERLGDDRTRQILLSDCTDVLVEDVIMVRPSLWMIVVDHCEDVVVENVKQIGVCSSSDGVDVVGSRRVRISNCFLRNGDDCVALKALNIAENKTRTEIANVADVTVEGCTLLSYLGGSAMEIGYELQCERVSGIRFQNCDVVAVHQFGSVFGIHNSDAALVEDVTWSDVRVEHHYDKLVDLRIVKSRWGKDAFRGQIRHVVLKDIQVQTLPYNAGYSCSIIGGYDAEHTVEGVSFENFRVDGLLISNADELSLFTRRASEISFVGA